jgi:hypothetical protein
MGADITVKDGYRIDWIPGSIHLFEDIVRQVGTIRAAAKTAQDVVLDRTVKELVNSIYGKLAQGVVDTRIIPDHHNRRRVFNTKTDKSESLGPSAITNAPMAAYCTGLVRALLLETISRLPNTAWIGTATTDGFLTPCGFDDIDQSGPVAQAFKAARMRISGDNTIWEAKHTIPRAIVTKTRGTYTVAPEDWSGDVVMAKTGYMTPKAEWSLSKIEQCRAWVKRYRERTYDTRLQMKSLTPLRGQHIHEVDMQTVESEVRWNADFDMKRRLIDVRDVCGLITADTTPWHDIEEFEIARELLDEWRNSQGRVLKTRQDYDDMMAWDEARGGRKATGTQSHNALSPVAAAVLKVMAHRAFGVEHGVLNGEIWHTVSRPPLNARAAKLMSGLCGIRITEMDLKNAKRRGARPDAMIHSISRFTDGDRGFLAEWFKLFPVAPDVLDVMELLCAPGSAAAGELDSLFDVAAAYNPEIDDCNL